MHKICVLATIIFCNIVNSFTQNRHCYSDEYLQSEIDKNPRRLDILKQIESHTLSFERSIGQRNNTVITIPAVVHIVYNTTSENIPDAQVISQIDILNKDFRRKNTDATNNWPQAADTQIEFCLASRDPNGGPTNGITRSFTSTSTFNPDNDAVKYTAQGGKNAWPSDQYLNIWVCDLTGSVLGYAQFPGGPSPTDGVVADYKVFGTGTNVTQGFHLGRTTTHEVGHWLNLKHIWGSSDCSTDDLVTDTPQSDAPNYGCSSGHWSCGTLDMVDNYMDYSNDVCMNLFTTGQKTRMQALFVPGGFRNSITKSIGCTAPDANPITCEKVKIEIKFDNYPQETSWNVKNEKGQIIMTSPKYSSLLRNTPWILDTCLESGCYTFTIHDTYSDGICCKYGNGNYTITKGTSIIGNGGNFTNNASHNFCITTIQPTCTDSIQNGNETGIDCGGSICPPCPTCTDKIKNGSETGIDCGGLDCAPCNTGENDNNTTGSVISNYFELGWDQWIGGASDTERYRGPFSWEGEYSIMIRDNSIEESAMTSPNIDLRGAGSVKIDFAFYASSMEKDEDFWLMYYDGNKWNKLKEYISETHFYNDNFYEVSFVLDGSKYNMSQMGKFRFQCDASTNSDQIYIDAVRITKIPPGGRIEEADKIVGVGHYIGTKNGLETDQITILPNPSTDFVNITCGQEIKNLYLYDLTGKILINTSVLDDNFSLDISEYKSGMYLLKTITLDGTTITEKLSKR